MNNAIVSQCQDPLYPKVACLHKLPETKAHTDNRKPAQFRVAGGSVWISGRRGIKTHAGTERRKLANLSAFFNS